MTGTAQQRLVQKVGSAQENSPLQTTRLHITPFTPELLPVYISTSSRTKAADISFHTIETFPEKAFGFVTLPVMEATNLRKKLHGSIVKGSKVRVEEARSEGSLKRKTEETDEADDTKSKRVPKKEKKSRDKGSKEEVLEGFELPSERKVKRGWAEPETKKHKKSEKRTEKAKYSKESELLFRTKVPKNMTNETTDKANKKEKKNEKSKRKSSRDVVVHEFEHTTKTPTFLKKQVEDGPSKHVHEYVEGKGWVDEDGNVIDDTKPRKLPDEKMDSILKDRKKSKSSKKDSKSKKEEKESKVDDEAAEDDANEESEDNIDPESEPKVPHPLETLFKRPRHSAEPQLEPVNATVSFSFFGQEGEEEEEEEEDNAEERRARFRPTKIDIPSTPFEGRQLRSGAPTPDTAAAFKRFSFSRGTINMNDKVSEESDEDSEGKDAMDIDGSEHDEDDEEEEAGVGEETGKKEESTFAKWFWEKRGDNNRAWKKRRKEAMKEKRRRENKRIARRVV